MSNSVRQGREGTLADELVEAAVAAGADPILARRPMAAAVRLWVPQAAASMLEALRGVPLTEVGIRAALREAAGLAALRQHGTVHGLAPATPGRTVPMTLTEPVYTSPAPRTQEKRSTPSRTPRSTQNKTSDSSRPVLRRTGSSPSVLASPSQHQTRFVDTETPYATPSPTEVDIEAPTPVSTRTRRSSVKRRPRKVIDEDDVMLVSAYLNISASAARDRLTMYEGDVVEALATKS